MSLVPTFSTVTLLVPLRGSEFEFELNQDEDRVCFVSFLSDIKGRGRRKLGGKVSPGTRPERASFGRTNVISDLR